MTSSLETKIKSSLEKSVQELDAETTARLQAIRRDALNQPSAKHWWSPSQLWMPMASLAICSLLAVMLWLPELGQAPQHSRDLTQTALLELLEHPEDLDMLSDPGFYLWMTELEAQDV